MLIPCSLLDVLLAMQVFSSVKLCCTVLDQSLVLSVLADLLAMATNLITLRLNSVVSYDTIPFEDYSNSANFSFTASSSTYSPVPSLSVVSCLLKFHVLHWSRHLHTCDVPLQLMCAHTFVHMLRSHPATVCMVRQRYSMSWSGQIRAS